MLLAKDAIAGTIYFKQVGEDSSENNIDWFEMDNVSHVEAILYIGLKEGYKSWYECISTDILQLLSDEDKQFAKLIPEFIQKEIALELGVNQSTISKRIKALAKKISKEYIKQYEDYKYIYWVKGEYKTCINCEKTKLKNEFYEGKKLCKLCILEKKE